MDQFIDNLARELANPTSRRGVMRLIGGAMLGGLVSAWKPVSLKAQTCTPACKKGKKCCTTGTSPFCVTDGKNCCGNTSCGGNKQCCPGPAPFCATNKQICCGKKSCKQGETCCGNTNCCTSKQTCIAGQCQASKGK